MIWMLLQMEQDLVAKGLNVTKTSDKYTGEKQNNSNESLYYLYI